MHSYRMRFQNGFPLVAFCSKLNAPGPSVVPAAKAYPIELGHVFTAVPEREVRGGEGRRGGAETKMKAKKRKKKKQVGTDRWRESR